MEAYEKEHFKEKKRASEWTSFVVQQWITQCVYDGNQLCDAARQRAATDSDLINMHEAFMFIKHDSCYWCHTHPEQRAIRPVSTQKRRNDSSVIGLQHRWRIVQGEHSGRKMMEMPHDKGSHKPQRKSTQTCFYLF